MNTGIVYRIREFVLAYPNKYTQIQVARRFNTSTQNVQWAVKGSNLGHLLVVDERVKKILATKAIRGWTRILRTKSIDPHHTKIPRSPTESYGKCRICDSEGILGDNLCEDCWDNTLQGKEKQRIKYRHTNGEENE